MTASRDRLQAADRNAVRELLPLVRRLADLDPLGLVRLRLAADPARDSGTATAMVRLPFGVLVSRTVHVPTRVRNLDLTLRTAEAITWLTGDAEQPSARDAQWRAGSPPSTGWQRVDSVPDDVVRGLVRSGALALKDAASRVGVPGAQPRAQVADALLDSAVLVVRDDAGHEAPVTLRALSALTRMGFLPRGGAVHVDIAGRWIRVVGGYGTAYLERPGHQLLLR